MILGWLRKYEGSSRKVEVIHVRAHAGNKGNEKADELVKKGVKFIRAELMLNAGGEGWFKRTVERYWRVRGR